MLLQVHDLEFAQIEVQVVEGLKNGNAALKKIQKVWNVCLAVVVMLYNVARLLIFVLDFLLFFVFVAYSRHHVVLW